MVSDADEFRALFAARILSLKESETQVASTSDFGTDADPDMLVEEEEDLAVVRLIVNILILDFAQKDKKIDILTMTIF